MKSRRAWGASVGWICACLVGCGRISFEPRDVGPDAFVPLGPFSTPTPVVELADVAEDDDPSLTDDRLEIYWETTRFGGFKIATSTRAAIGAPWSTPVLVAELASAQDDACPEISGDGLTLMFSSARPGGFGGYDLYTSTRLDRASAWAMPVWVAELSSPMDDFCAIVTETGLEVLFHSERAGGPGRRDLYRAVRSGVTAAWNTPVRIDELSSAGDDESAFPLPGALELWFGTNAGGNRDLLRTVRDAVGQPFGTPLPIEELDTPADESDAWLSRDGHTLFFATNRGGNSEIYEASR